MKKSEVARTFGVRLSTVKRYAALLKASGSLTPKKRLGKPLKVDERGTHAFLLHPSTLTRLGDAGSAARSRATASRT